MAKAPVVVALLGAFLATASYFSLQQQVQPIVPPAVKTLFDTWAVQYGKSYGFANDYQYRLQVFYNNLRIIDGMKRVVKHQVGANQFADMTLEEFVAKHTGLQASKAKLSQPQVDTGLSQAPVPQSVDWRTEGAVAPVKDQAQCGSCWAFSAVFALEGALALQKKKQYGLSQSAFTTLSEQQLVDCAGGRWGNQGCNGGLMTQAYDYVKWDKGLTTEQAYPYTAREGSCRKTQSLYAPVASYVEVPQSAQALAAAVAKQPVSIALAANRIMFYTGGVFDDKYCGTGLNHGVGLVGYGTEGGKDFWIVRNSWGARWGEAGYIRIRKDVASRSGMCGILMMNSYPVLKGN